MLFEVYPLTHIPADDLLFIWFRLFGEKGDAEIIVFCAHGKDDGLTFNMEGFYHTVINN